MALAKPVSGGCSCSRSATCGCGTGTPQAKHFDDGSVICVPYEHCSLIFVCRYRNCQSNPCLQVLMGAGSQIHAEGNSLFLESVVYCWLWFVLASRTWDVRAAAGVGGLAGTQTRWAEPVQEVFKQEICPERDSPHLSSPFSYRVCLLCLPAWTAEL